MKVKIEHYNTLKEGIKKVLEHNKTTFEKELQYYIDNNIGKDKARRLRWDLLYMAGLSSFLCRELYSYVNDNHVDTALKAIVREL